MNLNIFKILVIALFISSCYDNTKTNDSFHVKIYTDGFKANCLNVDSIQMVSKSEAYIWRNSTKQRILGDVIIPYD